MKIRLLNNTLRIRISQSEVSNLQSRRKVESKTEFPGGTLSYEVNGNTNEWDLGFKDNIIRLNIPKDQLDYFTSPQVITLKRNFHIDDGSSIKVTFEKDFKCLIEREDEDESDLFLNPRSK